MIPTEELKERIAEAERWLTCKCGPCRTVREGMGVDKIKWYIDEFKRLVNERELGKGGKAKH